MPDDSFQEAMEAMKGEGSWYSEYLSHLLTLILCLLLILHTVIFGQQHWLPAPFSPQNGTGSCSETMVLVRCGIIMKSCVDQSHLGIPNRIPPGIAQMAARTNLWKLITEAYFGP